MDDFTREDDPLHVCDLCDRDAVAEYGGLYRCEEHRSTLSAVMAPDAAAPPGWLGPDPVYLRVIDDLERAQRINAEAGWVQSDRYYVLVCRTCSPALDLPMPFETAEARGRWAGEHTRGTGHASWLVVDPRPTRAGTRGGDAMDTNPRGFTMTAVMGEAVLNMERRGDDGLLRLTVEEGTGPVTARQLAEVLAGVKPTARVLVDDGREGPVRSILIDAVAGEFILLG